MISSISLRVCRELTRSPSFQGLAGDISLLILQHLLPDTIELLGCLRGSGIEVAGLLTKSYSAKRGLEAAACALGVPVVQLAHDPAASRDLVVCEVRRSIAAARAHGKQLVLLDLGGFFRDAVAGLSAEERAQVAGIIEDTTYGHRRYVEAPPAVPVYSVARSRLKEIEARHVGKAVVSAIDLDLHRAGTALTGRRALVLGYGMIGSSVCPALQSRGALVSVYDIDDVSNLQAMVAGYEVSDRPQLLRRADLIVGATGHTSITADDLQLLKDGAVLASAGSQDTEFAVDALRRAAQDQLTSIEGITTYVLPGRRRIHLLREGTPVNFALGSVPDEIIDLVFAEILTAVEILAREHRGLAHTVHAIDDRDLQRVARLWIEHRALTAAPGEAQLLVDLLDQRRGPRSAPIGAPAPAVIAARRSR